MDDQVADTTDPRDHIERLEQRIEALSARIENCRKIMVASRVAVALGAALLIAMMVGVLRFDPLVFSAAVAAVLGGIVLSGSNRSTAREAEAQLAEAEAARAALIGRIDLHVIDGGKTLH